MANRSDGMNLTTKILLVAVIGGIYVVVRLAPGYIRDYQIQNVVEMAAKFYSDPSKRSTVPAYLTRKIDDMDLPVRVQDFVIIREGEDVVITHEWVYEATFIPKNPVVPEYKRYIRFKEEAREKIQGN